MIKKQNLNFKLRIFLKFLRRMKKKMTKYIKIQKKGIKKLERVDLDNNHKHLRKIFKLEN